MLKFSLLFGLILVIIAPVESKVIERNYPEHDGHRKHVHPLSLIKPNSITVKINKDIQLTAEPSLLQQSGEWVTVTFSKVPSPSNEDWIGVYSPSKVDISKHAPVKYQFCNRSSGYNETGSGTLRFKLVNMHEEYIFAILRGVNATLLQTSNEVTFANPNEVLQGHLALTGNDGEMKAMWNSGNIQNNQMVLWGTTPGSYPNSAAAVGITYTSSDLCGDVAIDFGWKDPGYLQSAVMTNLIPEQQYYYIFGGNATGWSDEQFFYAAPEAGAQILVDLIAYGDMGKGEEDGSFEHWEEVPSLNTTKNVYSQINFIDLILHIGDIAYAVGYSSQWDEFMAQIAPVAQRVPYMTLPGNHERDFPLSGSFYNGTDSGGECGIPYESRFPMPNVDRLTQWYSFNYGNIHFVMMSTEHNFLRGSAQFQFIDADLRSVDRSVTPWVIFSGHRPMYIDSTDNSSVSSDQTVAHLLRENVEELLVKHGVDLALWGHHHSYQRSCPLYKGECHREGNFPIHAVIGMGGMGLSQNLETIKPLWVDVVDDTEYGYSRITTTQNSLLFQYFSNTRGMRDEFVLVKN